MRSEVKNFIRRLLNPNFAIESILYGGKMIASGLLRKILPPTYFYPAGVKKVLSRLQSNCCVIPIETHQQPQNEVASGYLQLATKQIYYSGAPDWEAVFSDPEDTESLHRWNWLLTSVASLSLDRRAKVGIGLVISWVRHRENSQQGFVDDAYSTGERISNFCIFWGIIGKQSKDGQLEDIPSELRYALNLMVVGLANNLEYSSITLTGNHAFNNARALFLGGQCLGLSVLTELSFEIIKERLPALITSDGFFSEGSSHYHFLFTRWVLEILLVADRTQHFEMQSLVRKYSSLLVQRCWFYMVFNSIEKKWVIPFIGDVSPDFAPEWLIGLPWSSIAVKEYSPIMIPPAPGDLGWAGLWQRSEVPDNRWDGKNKNYSSQSFVNSSWHRVDFSEWSLFVFAGTDDGVVRASHRHTDLGSFVLFFRGLEIFSDPGRYSYLISDPLGEYGLSAKSHNTLFIDGLAPMVERRSSRLPKKYRAVQVLVNVLKSENQVSVKITHNGFERLQKHPVTHQRILVLKRDVFEIIDKLNSKICCFAEWNFQFGGNIKLKPLSSGNSYLFEHNNHLSVSGVFGCESLSSGLDNLKSQLTYGNLLSPVSGWISNRYGGKLKSNTLVFGCNVKLPFESCYFLKIN
jgi:hypothetical protein